MVRPKRIYKSKKGAFYYLRKGKKVYVKASTKTKKGKIMSQKQIVNIMIKNIVGDSKGRRIKPRKKRKKLKYTKQVADEQKEVMRKGLPVYLFEPQKIIPSITQQVSTKAKKETDSYKDVLKQLSDIKKLTERKTKNIQTVPSSPVKINVKKTKAETYTYATFFKFIKNILLKSFVYKEDVPEIINDMEKDELFRDTLFKKFFEQYNVDIFNERRFFLLVQKMKNIEPNELYRLILTFINVGYEVFEKINAEEKQALEKGDDPNVDIYSPVNDEMVDQMVSGSGSSDGGGLYNGEIEKITKKIIDDSTIPVIAKNQLKDLDEYVKPNMKRFGFIINTDTAPQKNSEGGHWRCVFINNSDDYKSIEYFDPLVSTPEKALVQKLREISKLINPHEYFLFKNNNLQSQPDNSPNCGYHCILFLEKRFHGIPWSEATYYDEFMKTHKPEYQEGEEEVKKKIKKYSSYI